VGLGWGGVGSLTDWTAWMLHTALMLKCYHSHF